MIAFKRKHPAIEAAALLLTVLYACTGTALAQGQISQCQSNRNIGFVENRLQGAIDHLSHDARDYGGHRANAMGALEAARSELSLAEKYFVTTTHDNGDCFRATGPDGGSDLNWPARAQKPSDSDVWGVRAWVGRLVNQLSHDDRDYGGHRVSAIAHLGTAQNELLAAEHYARVHGN